MKIYSKKIFFSVTLVILLIVLLISQFSQSASKKYTEINDKEYYAYRFSLKDIKLNLLKRLPPNSNKSAIIINASYFDTESKPLGLAVLNQKIVNKAHRNSYLINALMLYKNSQITFQKITDFQIASAAEYDLIIQAGPLLIKDGEKLVLEKNRNLAIQSSRTAVCLDSSQRFIVFVSKTKISLGKLQNIFLEDFNCQNALNFDGGGSTQLYKFSPKIGRETLINSLVRPPFFLEISY